MFTTVFYNQKINYSKHVNGRDRVLEEVHVFYSFVINNNITITVLLLINIFSRNIVLTHLFFS